MHLRGVTGSRRRREQLAIGIDVRICSTVELRLITECLQLLEPNGNRQPIYLRNLASFFYRTCCCATHTRASTWLEESLSWCLAWCQRPETSGNLEVEGSVRKSYPQILLLTSDDLIRHFSKCSTHDSIDSIPVLRFARRRNSCSFWDAAAEWMLSHARYLS